MDTALEQSVAKCLDGLLGSADHINDPEISKCRNIYTYVRDMAQMGGLRLGMDSMCECEKVFPDRIYPSYQDVRDILFGDPELIPTFLDQYKLLCLWRINLKE